MPKPKTAGQKPVIRLKNTDVTNRAHARELVLELAKKFRAHKFTRVADSLFEDCERASRIWLHNRVMDFGKNPSNGQTIR